MFKAFRISDLRRFSKEEGGTSTIEFVIIFPVLLVLLLTFVSLSVYIAIISDVQQITADLTRQSLRYVDMGNEADEICAALSIEVLPLVSQEFAFVEPKRISELKCHLASDNPSFSVSLIYSMDGHYVQRFVEFFGLDLYQFTRRAQMWI